MMQLLMLIIQTISLAIIFSSTSQIKISFRSFLILLLTSIVTGLLIGNLLVLILIPFLYLIGLSHGIGDKKLLALFYSSYSITFYTVFANLFAVIVEKTIGSYSILEFIVMILPVVINYFILKFFKSGILFLKANYALFNHAFLAAINTIIIAICVIQVVSYLWENNVNNLGNLRYFITVFFIFTILVLVSYLNKKLHDFQKVQLDNLKDQQLTQLSQYANQVEALYFDIRNIRHDFVNIIKSLDYAIQEKNIQEIKNIYDTVINQVGASLQNNKFDFARLSNIKIDALKSLLATKIIEAQQKKIQINIEIFSPLENLYIDLLDSIRIVSIFLDNAIEASESLIGEREINLAVIVNAEKKEHILIVENKYNPDEQLDVRAIYTKGFSTKGTHRGLGLRIVKDLIAKHPNTALETEITNGTFRQQIIFKEVT